MLLCIYLDNKDIEITKNTTLLFAMFDITCFDIY